MKLHGTWMMFVIACGGPVAALAQLQLLPDQQPQRAFAGDARKIAVVWHNDGDNTAEAEIRARIVQTSSATTVRLGETPWKKLQVLPQQTVLESARLDFPPVKAETKFIVQWLENSDSASENVGQASSLTVDGTSLPRVSGGKMPPEPADKMFAPHFQTASNSVIGKTEVLVYPTNLLGELKLLVDEGEKKLGVLDPKNQLKPALKSSAVKFVDLEETALDEFSGKLAIVGPCNPDDPEWNGLANRISKLARNGTPVVWIQSPLKKRDKIQPSFYIVPQNRAVVVVVQPELVTDLPDNPQSQLNLIYFSKLALNPQPPVLHDLSSQP